MSLGTSLTEKTISSSCSFLPSLTPQDGTRGFVCPTVRKAGSPWRTFWKSPASTCDGETCENVTASSRRPAPWPRRRGPARDRTTHTLTSCLFLLNVTRRRDVSLGHMISYDSFYATCCSTEIITLPTTLPVLLKRVPFTRCACVRVYGRVWVYACMCVYVLIHVSV